MRSKKLKYLRSISVSGLFCCIFIFTQPSGAEERFPVVVILENRFLLVPSGGHMVDSAGVFDAEGADLEQG
jgi:hypothetical protein